MAAKRKYVMGWLKMKPGKRDAFLEEYAKGAAATRREAGCVFYDYAASTEDADTVLIMECFESEAAHAAHLQQPHFKAVWAAFEKFGASGNFLDMWSDEAKPSSVEF
jgi:quinol monooxygenase YgiN